MYAEATGCWHRISRQRRLWLRDTWIDHALVVLPRAEAVLTTGDLITKGEAIGRLAGFGVPGSLIQEIRDRRDGRAVTVTWPGRLVRTVRARRLMQHGVAHLPPPALDPEC